MLSEKELDELYEKMSPEERLGQITQLNNLYFEADGMITGDTNKYISSRTFAAEELSHLGTLFNLYGKEKLRKMQENHLKDNITPLLFMADVTFGFFVSHPSGLGQAATFDTELIEKIARHSAVEATGEGINITFSPQSDLSRDARWGRCSGSYGEDVYLQEEMTKAVVRGYQGKIGNPDSMVACVKHFAGYGAPISGKDYDDVDISKRTMLECYLPPYRAAIDAGARMVMTSFNSYCGVPLSLNKELVRDTLRKDWGFDGVVISDYSAISGCATQGSANSWEDIAKYAMEATVDIDMMDNFYQRYVPELIKSGKLDENIFKESVMRILRLKNDMGILDDPYLYFKAPVYTFEDYKKSYADAEKAVMESCILLKNEENMLPIKKKEGTVVIGPFAEKSPVAAFLKHYGVGQHLIEDAEGMQKTLAEELGNLPYEYGCPMLERDNFIVTQSDGQDAPCYINEEENFKNAVELAKNAERVIVTIGEAPGQHGESRSRAKIDIPEIQLNMLREIYKVNKNIITLVFCGRPVLLDEVSHLSKSVLCCWDRCVATNSAIAKLVLGKEVPSGKVPMSFLRCVGQAPLSYDYKLNCHSITSPEGNYTLRYLDVSHTPLYPFGYGLSYTKFEYSDLKIDKDVMKPDEVIKASVKVTNIGDCDGVEVVQLYIKDNAASMIARPNKQLKGFKRVSLKKGASKTVEFEINEKMLKFWNAENVYDSEAGRFTAFIGGDSTVSEYVNFNLVK